MSATAAPSWAAVDACRLAARRRRPAVGGNRDRGHASTPGQRTARSIRCIISRLNQFGRPAVANGPAARNIHAADEAVEPASIVRGARTLARFIAGFFARGGLPASEISR